MNSYKIIIASVVSEKSVSKQGDGKYTFLVHRLATKTAIKRAVKEIYAVDAEEVNICTRLGKLRRRGRGVATVRRQERKKAIVTIKKGQVLDSGKIYAEHKKKDDK